MMFKTISIIFTVLFSAATFAEPCQWGELLQGLQHEKLINFDTFCSKLPPIKKEKDLKEVMEFFFDQNKKNNHANRHQATRQLNICQPTPQSKALIIAFEGTGAYEPLAGVTFAQLNKCFGGKIPPSLINSVYPTFEKIYKNRIGKERKWSGLQSGIQSELLSMKDSHTVDWYSFPSEEVEQLAGLEQLANISIPQLVDDIIDSVESNPKGIQNARGCIKKYLREAKKMGIEPKIILTSHSSGGRSLVKFAEHMKTDVGVKVDLAFSIDPVIEAHHALEEVVPQKIGEPARYAKWKAENAWRRLRGLPETEYPYSAVWHRDHKSKLYKPSNVLDHQSFYQLEDRLGLKLGGDLGRFGIKGSSMEGANNQRIKVSSVDAHGPIAYDKKVLEIFRKKVSDLLK